jgi:hypothetical protein
LLNDETLSTCGLFFLIILVLLRVCKGAGGFGGILLKFEAAKK